MVLGAARWCDVWGMEKLLVVFSLLLHETIISIHELHNMKLKLFEIHYLDHEYYLWICYSVQIPSQSGSERCELFGI